MNETAPYVVLGAGPAGVVAAEALREIDPAHAVVLVGDEPEPPYSRMALPYLLAEDIGEDGTWLRRKPGHFDGLGIAVRRGRATNVDTATRTVTLENGGVLGYRSLLIATGSRATRPPIPGMDLDGIENCWTLADARRIAAATRPGARVVLMGAGFIGCIVLEALAARGVALTVVEMEDRMVPRMMDRAGGDMIKRWCEGKGVAVRTGTRIVGIERQGGGLRLALADGGALDADLVVCATGVRPNTAFLDGSGIATGTGVIVDDHLATNVPGVYAAGDVAEGFDFSTGAHQIHAIQPTAADHGRVAALNMTGRPTRYRGSLSMNVLNTLGLISSSFGQWDGVAGGETAVLSDPERFRYIRLSFEGDVLVGALALGLTQHVGVLRGLIQTRVRLGHWKERLKDNPLLMMDAYLARTQGAVFGI
ncbi:MAG: NAD(P)/FAD-dependent oxidoreductase [Rhizobiales bacterium]|nr:NAD(P)/FAD-dependent oxidoreductase [Hyphomicrobiales bacterium]